MPSKEFMSAAVNIMDIALGIEVGICSNIVLERNTIMPLMAVNREMPITPRTGVHLKKLPPEADDIKAERKPEPSYAIVDSQSVKTIYDSKERGFDGGKKSKRKKKEENPESNLMALIHMYPFYFHHEYEIISHLGQKYKG